MKAPQIFVHVRVSADVSIDQLEGFRNDVLALAALHGEIFYVRVKRRRIGPRQIAKLVTAYEKREQESRRAEKSRQPDRS